MSSALQFPNKRLEYAGTGNPLFISDIVTLSENLQTALQSLLGLSNSDFAIISGFDYTLGVGYSAGIVFMSGVFYYSASVLIEGKYLIPSITQAEYKTFEDASSHYAYQINYAVTSNTLVSGGSPVAFAGNMNKYRLNSSLISSFLAGDINEILKAFGDSFIVSGCVVTYDGSDPIHVSDGYVFLEDKLYIFKAQDVTFASAALYFSIDTNYDSITIESSGDVEFCYASGVLAISYLVSIVKKLTDTGDKTAADFTSGSFTIDANRHALDISSKVPAKTTWILANVYISATGAGDYIFFFKYGNTHDYNIAILKNLTAIAAGIWTDVWIPVDSQLRIGYTGSGVTVNQFTIRAYM